MQGVEYVMLIDVQRSRTRRILGGTRHGWNLWGRVPYSARRARPVKWQANGLRLLSPYVDGAPLVVRVSSSTPRSYTLLDERSGMLPNGAVCKSRANARSQASL